MCVYLLESCDGYLCPNLNHFLLFARASSCDFLKIDSMLPEHVLLHTIIHIVLSLNYPTLSSIFNSPPPSLLLFLYSVDAVH